MKKVMVFGIFDGLHAHHRAMLEEACAYGDHLAVVVPQDHIVEHITGKLPEINLAARFDELKAYDKVDEVIIGDAEMAAWRVVKRFQPDVVCFAPDQELLLRDLEMHKNELGYDVQIIRLTAKETSSQ
ncbi:adenylyltransferase/cytidyltransferase family protein [Candidatus Uhrbacteria bacterium]|nr:adenylyltransferase/cytidyltransferase family protein [Candidatus Uhrbacteria bacterium]